MRARLCGLTLCGRRLGSSVELLLDILLDGLCLLGLLHFGVATGSGRDCGLTQTTSTQRRECRGDRKEPYHGRPPWVGSLWAASQLHAPCAAHSATVFGGLHGEE